MDIKLLENLTNAYGVSGNEADVRKIITKHIRPYVDKIKVDDLGNLIALKKGKKPRIMLASHMDEIGLMVRGITNQGFLQVSAIGGIEPSLLICQRVHVDTKKRKQLVHGLITTKEISNDEELPKTVEMEHLLVDTGLTKKALQSLGVGIGSYIALDEKFHLMNHHFFYGKALDDRIGCFILLELAKKLKKLKYEIAYAFTVQEEVGLYGAKTSAYNLEPDLAIAVDVAPSNDLGTDPTLNLGKGPTITIKDAEMIASVELNDWLKKTAKKHKIPAQLEVSDLGTTDALNISISKGGIPSTVVGVPIRNMHTAVGVGNLKDVENAIKLLATALKNPPHI